MNFRYQKGIESIGIKMYRACPQRRNRLNNLQPNGVGKESRHCSLLASKRNLTQQPTPCYDERFPWGMSEASIVRWVLGICCLFLLFPGTKSTQRNIIFLSIYFIT